MPNKAGINFTDGSYQGKSANNVYHGYNGVVNNPQTSSYAKENASAQMQSFSDASRNTHAGYNGVVNNPQTSDAAKSAAYSKMQSMPKW